MVLALHHQKPLAGTFFTMVDSTWPVRSSMLENSSCSYNTALYGFSICAWQGANRDAVAWRGHQTPQPAYTKSDIQLAPPHNQQLRIHL